MANNEIKTNAEIYREQRKEQLAKAKKKKGSAKRDKIIQTVIKVVCIVLVAGIVLYGVANVLTNVFCLPQKVLTAAKMDDKKITVAEYNYYYLNLYNQVASISQQYDSYYGAGSGAMYTGFDISKNPADQEYVGAETHDEVETWADYFKYNAAEKAFINMLVYEDAMSEEAKKAGFELSEETNKEIQDSIDEVIESLTKNAENSDFSLNNYIAKTCGEGLTEKSYTELLRRDSIVEHYLTWYQENLAENYTEDEIKAYYNDNKDTLDQASIRLFSVSYAEIEGKTDDPTYTKAEAKERADEFLGKITDEASFIALAKEYAAPSAKDDFKNDSATNAANMTKETVSQTSKNLAKWMFDDARALGDKAVIHDKDNELYFIAYLTKVATPDKETAGATVRHILVQADTEKENSEGNKIPLSDAEIEANFDKAYKEAKKILKEWKKGAATEDSFAALATEKTDDTGSAETGGLYEDITSTSSYVPEFLDWALADHEVGDTEIVKTQYGYHIMYFVGADEMEKWESDARTALAAEDYDEYAQELYDITGEKTERNDTIINLFMEAIEEIIESHVAYYQSSASSSQITY